MILPVVLSRLNRLVRFRRRYIWSPALDLRDRAVFAALIPHAQY